MQNLMKFLLFSKSNRKWSMAKTEVVQKKANRRRLEIKGKRLKKNVKRIRNYI